MELAIRAVNTIQACGRVVNDSAQRGMSGWRNGSHVEVKSSVDAAGKFMRLFNVLIAIIFAFPVFGAPSGQRNEACGVVAGSPPQFNSLPTLHVATLTGAEAFALPPNSPGNASAVVCERLSLVPAGNDYKVLQAGLPFAIKNPQGATLWLELHNGQLAVTYKEDELTASQAAQLQAWLNRVQPFFQAKPPSSRSSGN